MLFLLGIKGLQLVVNLKLKYGVSFPEKHKLLCAAVFRQPVAVACLLTQLHNDNEKKINGLRNRPSLPFM